MSALPADDDVNAAADDATRRIAEQLIVSGTRVLCVWLVILVMRDNHARLQHALASSCDCDHASSSALVSPLWQRHGHRTARQLLIYIQQINTIHMLCNVFNQLRRKLYRNFTNSMIVHSPDRLDDALRNIYFLYILP